MSDIYVGIRKATDDGIPESDLRQHVCPQCGNVDILTGDGELDKDVKPILAGDKLDEGYEHYAAGGGFVEFRYRYLPHKCTACGARFTAVKREKAHLNKEVIAWYALFAITAAAHIALTMLLIANGVPAWLAPIGIGVPLSLLYVNVVLKIHDNTLDKDPGPEYICEHGLSDAPFRRLERKYEEESKEEDETEEDLDETSSSDGKKTIQDVFESLTQEQKAVVEYLIGDHMQIYANGQPIMQFPQPTMRPWDIQF